MITVYYIKSTFGIAKDPEENKTINDKIETLL